MPEIRKRIATYNRMADFSHAPETVNRRQQQELSNQLSKYLIDIMGSDQSRSKVTQSQDI